MEIVIPIGIPGSGKTRLYKMRYSHLALVSKDLINKEITGDINDYSKPKELTNEINKRIDELVERGESFYLDDTNLDKNVRSTFVNRFKGTDVKITYVVFPVDFELSKRRIEEDIKNNVERSSTPHSWLVLQLGLYNFTIGDKFKDENVQEIIYLKPGELD